jgi:hypothetical protein
MERDDASKKSHPALALSAEAHRRATLRAADQISAISLGGQLQQHASEFAGAIGFAQKPSAFGQILFPDIHKA